MEKISICKYTIFRCKILTFSERISSTYKSFFKELVGKWDLGNYANYDEIRRNNFYGLGNITLPVNTDINVNRIRSEEYSGNVNLNRVIQNKHKFTFGVGYSSYSIIKDMARYLIKSSSITSPAMKGNEEYGSINAAYVFQTLNDSILPTKGLSFKIGGDYTNIIGRSVNDVTITMQKQICMFP